MPWLISLKNYPLIQCANDVNVFRHSSYEGIVSFRRWTLSISRFKRRRRVRRRLADRVMYCHGNRRKWSNRRRRFRALTTLISMFPRSSRPIGLCNPNNPSSKSFSFCPIRAGPLLNKWASFITSIQSVSFIRLREWEALNPVNRLLAILQGNRNDLCGGASFAMWTFDNKARPRVSLVPRLVSSIQRTRTIRGVRVRKENIPIQIRKSLSRR